MKKWVEPTHATPERELTAEDETSWRVHGYALVHGLIEPSVVRDAQNEFFALMKREKPSSGMDGYDFPTSSLALNDVILNERIIVAVRRLLCTDDVLLTQADAWPKEYSTEKNTDQRIHIDAWNHMNVVPPRWDCPSSVAMIVYLTDIEQSGGATAVVPRRYDADPAYDPLSLMRTPGCGALPYINRKHEAERYFQGTDPDTAKFREGLYEREVFANAKQGTVLFYRHDTWHRGTPLTVPGTTRLVMNLSYRRVDAQWFQHWTSGWGRTVYAKDQIIVNIIAKGSVMQRGVLGFPMPGDKYWTEETVRLVGMRYAHLGFDSTPYRLKAKL